MGIKSIIVVFFCLVALQSCYTTSGYRTVGGNYFHRYSNDTLYYEQNMDRFGKAYPDLMLDSSFVNKHFPVEFFSSITERKHVFSGKALYPLFPLMNYFGLKSWYIKSPDKEHIYEIGLFTCRSRNPKQNLCAFSLYNVYRQSKQKISWVELREGTSNLSKEDMKEAREQYLRKFESEIIPLLKPYFPVMNN